MSVINFDARQVAPDEGRGDPIPAGWYSAAAVELEQAPTNDGAGIKITGIFQVIDGVFKGRKVYHNFNYQNASEKAQDIGRKQFSALCHATRVLMVERTEQLLNIPIKVRVKIKPAEGQYEPKNEITAFKDINDQAVAASLAAAPAAVAKAPAIPAPPTGVPAAMPAAIPAVQTAAPQWQAPAVQQPWAQGGQVPAAPPVQAAPPVHEVAQVAAAPVQAAPAEAPQVQVAQAAPAGQEVPPWMKAQPA